MSPRSPIFYVAHEPPRDPIIVCDALICWTPAGQPLSDLLNILLSEFSVYVLLSTGVVASFAPVARIGAMVPEIEVLGVDARRIVAVVTHENLFGEGPRHGVMEVVTCPVSEAHNDTVIRAANHDLAIPALRFHPPPLPTFLRGAWRSMFPKAFMERLSGTSWASCWHVCRIPVYELMRKGIYAKSYTRKIGSGTPTDLTHGARRQGAPRPLPVAPALASPAHRGP
jgi:hypothetical protein